MVVGIKLGPVHGDHDLFALRDHVRDPVMKHIGEVELGIGEQAIDLFHCMLAVHVAGDREAIADGMDRERARFNNALGRIGEGKHALGIHVLAKYIIDALEDRVVVEHGVVS